MNNVSVSFIIPFYNMALDREGRRELFTAEKYSSRGDCC